MKDNGVFRVLLASWLVMIKRLFEFERFSQPLSWWPCFFGMRVQHDSRDWTIMSQKLGKESRLNLASGANPSAMQCKAQMIKLSADFSVPIPQEARKPLTLNQGVKNN